MRPTTLQLDIAVAALAALLLLILAPGLAIAGLVAILVLLVCGVSVLVDRWVQRRQRHRRI